MSIKSKYLNEWIAQAAKRYNIPFATAEAIYDAQWAFIRDAVRKKQNVHITNLGKFYNAREYAEFKKENYAKKHASNG